ncbi:glycosyltransferase WbuB [Candidatus Parcubacteria bacterium]|jgi:glycosyltransferase involved in cell wall biosynthesis|nr:MAG: glycosyltransferase WbuB [Candidatus Parcubacteria bacterium]
MAEKQLNILYHFRVRGTGAEGVHIAGIVNGFRALGHNVRLVSPTNADPTAKTSEETRTDRPTRVITVLLHKLADILPQPFFEIMEFLYNFFAIIKLWKNINNNDVDFIYERYAFFNLAGVLVAKRKKIPLILEVNELSGHKRIRGQFFVRLCSVIEKYILCRSVLVVTVSDFLNRIVSSKIDPQKTNVITIPNGVPKAWLERKISLDEVINLRKKYNLHGKKVICFVGGLEHWHNFDLLLQAVKTTQDSISGVVMMFIGDGPLKNFIQNRSRALALQPDSVLFVGKVPHFDVPAYLKMADIAVIPETNDFRSPIKMYEYMAMGLPVVAPKKPAIETAITHKVDGILFEPKNVQSLAYALLQCLSKDELAKKLGQNALQRVLNNFTWEKHAEHILQTYAHCKFN